MARSLASFAGWTVVVSVAALSLVGTVFVGLREGPHWDALEGELPGRAPFTEVRWRGDVPEVRVDGELHELVAIDGVPAEELVALCQDLYGARWRKRFAEDLVEVMARRGRPALLAVDLELRDLATGEVETRRDVPMTEANRDAVWSANHPEFAAMLAGPMSTQGARGAALALAPAPRTAGGDFAKLSPFTAVRWDGDRPEVRFEGRWYRPLGMAGLEVERIVEHCRAAFGDRWRKRFAEDLVEVLDGLGVAASDTIALELEDLETGEAREVATAPMTEENRRAVWRANRALLDAIGAGGDVERLERAHAETVDEELRELSVPLAPDAVWSSVTLARTAAEQDLDQLEQLLVDRFAYLRTKGVDRRAAFDAVRLGLGDAIDRNAFAIQVMKLLALFGDGHTRVGESPTAVLPPGYLPFLVADSAGRAVAFTADRQGLVDPERPYLRAIDGLPVGVWLERAASVGARGSPAFVRRNALRNLRYVGWLRRELLLPASPALRVVLEDERGEDPRELELELSATKPNHGEWPRRETGILDGDVGYLRIARMESGAPFAASLHAAMERFRGTRGLVIDVRGNGGGSRDATLALLPYFLTPEESPLVVNAAYYRLPPGEPAGRAGGYLADRYLFPVDHGGWSSAARRAAQAFARDFRPEPEPGAGFSRLHVLVIDAEARPYRYTAPVVVLQDGDCFSATDIFLGAFAEADGVTLMGTPSGGGSGRSRPARLANSGLALRVSSMASFCPDGRLYDGRGIEPDVVVEPAPTDWTFASDTVLEAALEHLSR